MSNSKSIILKTKQYAIFDLGKIHKALCVIDAENVAKLLDYIGLAANPRESKKNKVTAAIWDTLSTSPEEMVNRTKGLLISTQSCEPLERGRFKLKFEDGKTDGLLDGGHNMLAIGSFLLEKFYESQDLKIPKDVAKISCWEDFSNAWKKYRDEIDEFIQEQEFLIPIEIIYPTSCYDYDFAELVFEISDARNNNSALTAGTKADHRGYYDDLKSCIDSKIVDLIAWKDNEAGKCIKREDVVALSLIPIIALQRAGKIPHDAINLINPIMIYNSKGACVEVFSKLIEYYNNEGGLPPIIKNAFRLMSDIPKLYDEIYLKFPDAYNKYSPRFGGISSVKGKDEHRMKTKFYKKESTYKYPDGYILPFVCSLHKLIKVDGDSVFWVMDNIYEVVDKLPEHCKMLVGVIKDNNYDANKVGKSSAAYEGCEMSMDMIKMSLNS